ncbi:MAG: rhodanese-like domain-containing protein [Armatimonadetes bacterium]|nr:rhodanese-like domain-containing protein [Armatimonadota bacterium]
MTSLRQAAVAALLVAGCAPMAGCTPPAGPGATKPPAIAVKPLPDLTPAELRKRLAAPKPPLLLDVREAGEREEAKISPSKHIPLGDLPARLKELDKKAEIVVYCHSGRRSAHAAQILRDAGFSKVRNLAGGMSAWQSGL